MKINRTKLAVAACCLGSLAASNSGLASLSYLDISYYGDYGVTVVAQNYQHATLATAFSADRLSGSRNNAGQVGTGAGFVTSEPLPVNHSDPFVTFCLDINTILQDGWWQSGSFSDVPSVGTVGNPNNPTGPAIRNVGALQIVANLYANYAGGILPVGGWGAASTAQKLEGAALQLAIWEVLYDTTGTGIHNGYNVYQDGVAANNSSEFYLKAGSTAVGDRANQMLAAYGVVDPNLGTTFWNAVYNDGTYRSSQDLIGPNGPTGVVVPEPTTMIAGALLLLPFGVSTIRILKKQRAA